MPLPLLAVGAALAPILVKELPSIASWMFGDKTGKAIEAVTGAARQVFGTDDAASLEAAMAADPAKLLEFKRMVLQAEGEERERKHQELLATLADVQSARNQTVELAKAGSPLSWGSSIVSVLAVAVFAGFVAMLFFKVVPEGMKEALLLLGGSAATGYGMVLSYWLGSSSGSASKDVTLTKALSK